MFRQICSVRQRRPRNEWDTSNDLIRLHCIIVRIIWIQWIHMLIHASSHKWINKSNERNIFIDATCAMIYIYRTRLAAFNVHWCEFKLYTIIHDSVSHAQAHAHCWCCLAHEICTHINFCYCLAQSVDALGKLCVVFVGWLLRFQFSFRLNSSDLIHLYWWAIDWCAGTGNYHSSALPARTRNWFLLSPCVLVIWSFVIS